MHKYRISIHRWIDGKLKMLGARTYYAQDVEHIYIRELFPGYSNEDWHHIEIWIRTLASYTQMERGLYEWAHKKQMLLYKLIEQGKITSEKKFKLEVALDKEFNNRLRAIRL